MSLCVITVVREAQPDVIVGCDEVTVNYAKEVLNVYAGETGLQGKKGDVGSGLAEVTHDGTLTGKGTVAESLATTGDMTLNNFNEDSEALVFTAGAAALNVNTCKNKQFMTLTQEGFITTSGTPVTGKPILLIITHSGSAWPLNWNGTALTILVGAVGETERVLAQWGGSDWQFDSIGLFDQTV